MRSVVRKPGTWFGGTLVALAVATVLMVRTRNVPTLDRAQVPHAVGVFHLHSANSHDSQVPLETYLDAAHALGLDFIVLTDHNNQSPHAQTRDSVTVLSYAELSTSLGHVVQLGAPYTLARDMRQSPAVLSTLRTMGATPIVAHPSDLKRPWTGAVDGAGGIEIANVAASARRAAQPVFLGLLPQLLAWPLNANAVMTSLYDRDNGALALWDEQSDPSVVGLCGTDAHGWLPSTLNLQTWFVVTEVALPEGDGRAAAIVDALRGGRFHCVAAQLGRDPEFAFTAWHNGENAGGPGDTIPQDKVTALSVSAPNSTHGVNQIVLLRNGAEITRSTGRTMRYESPPPGTYRVEIRALVPNLLLGEHWVPVIYSNRIRVAPTPAGVPLPGKP